MTFFGTGDQDWVELDLDRFDVEIGDDLVALVEANRDALVRLTGDTDFTVELGADGAVRVVGTRRFRAQVDHHGRLLLTGEPDPEGPL